MKSVGKQLEEARMARNWTPELAARETKIKVDRVRDLESDNYSQFSSPAYARGFVRTYARALGLDEYRILRQLDNKLPEDDNASFVNDTGLPYVPETAKAIHASSGNRTGLYIFAALGCGVLMITAFVLLQAYRAGELPRYFASTSSMDSGLGSTNLAPVADSEEPPHALPVDPNDTTHSVRALPVNLNDLAADTNDAVGAAPGASIAAASDNSGQPMRAQPVDLNSGGNAVAGSPVTPANGPAPAAEATPARPPPGLVDPATAKTPPRALPVDPSDLAGGPNPAAVAAAATGNVASADTAAPASPAMEGGAGSLMLRASRDSFVRVTSLDPVRGQQVLYASVLRSGQTLSFGGHKFSVNVDIPSAVEITLDGVNYGPHSDRNSPETFTLQSHQP